MRLIRTQISVSGLTADEVRNGLADLRAEFNERPWIIRPEAAWDDEQDRLIIAVHYEGDDPETVGQAASDEVWDCVIACLTFSSNGIHFEIKDSAVVNDA